jgi:hypothetical protein
MISYLENFDTISKITKKSIHLQIFQIPELNFLVVRNGGEVLAGCGNVEPLDRKVSFV